MAPPGRQCATPNSFIDESLQAFNEAELTDVIRIAQRLLKAKVQQARADAMQSGKRQWRFWDKALDLDWNSTGLPQVQFPRRRSSEAEVDWRVFQMLKGTARELLQVDWEVFELLSPLQKAKEVDVDWDVFHMLSPQAVAEPEAEPESLDFLAVDWSGDRLPHFKVSTPPMRRPGFSGRVRAGKYHRAIQPRRRKETAPEDSSMAKIASPVSWRPSVSTKSSPALPRKARLSAARMVPRIQQPGGGGR